MQMRTEEPLFLGLILFYRRDESLFRHPNPSANFVGKSEGGLKTALVQEVFLCLHARKQSDCTLVFLLCV